MKKQKKFLMFSETKRVVALSLLIVVAGTYLHACATVSEDKNGLLTTLDVDPLQGIWISEQDSSHYWIMENGTLFDIYVSNKVPDPIKQYKYIISEDCSVSSGASEKENDGYSEKSLVLIDANSKRCYFITNNDEDILALLYVDNGAIFVYRKYRPQ